MTDREAGLRQPWRVVESQLAAGVLSCPCSGALSPWGHARERTVIGADRFVRVRPRRDRCRACRATHVLLPAGLLLRRGFTVEVIGRVLELAALAVSARRIARTAGVARSTVRGWLARFTGRVELLRAHFTAWLLWHAPSTSQIPPTGGPVGDVVAVVAAAGAVAVEVLSAESVWAFASAATGGRLLANTSPPFPAPWPRSRCCWRCQLLAQQSPPEDEAACEHVHVAADAFDRDDHARMMDSMRRAHESAGSQHLHWRSKMVLKVFNATGEIYDYSPRSSTQLQQRRSASFP